MASRGQAFTSLKILIGAVFAASLLVIVYAIVDSYNYPITAGDIVQEIVLDAYRFPSKCFARENVAFQEDDILLSNFLKPADDYSVVLESDISSVECQTSSQCTAKSDTSTPASAICYTSTKRCRVYVGSAEC